jgi:CRP-like cAMP-binding protein
MVARHCDLDRVPMGTTLIEQGRATDQLRIVAHGAVEVFIDGRSRGELHAGDVIGFGAAATGGSPGTAVATTDLALISLDLDELWQLTLASGLGRAMVMGLGAFVVGIAPESFTT